MTATTYSDGGRPGGRRMSLVPLEVGAEHVPVSLELVRFQQVAVYELADAIGFDAQLAGAIGYTENFIIHTGQFTTGEVKQLSCMGDSFRLQSNCWAVAGPPDRLRT